jgi:transcriptional regulator with XRE-family HTH domain
MLGDLSSGDFLGLADFPGESSLDPLGASQPDRNAENMGATKPQIARNTSHQPAIQGKLSEFPVGRGMLRCNFVACHGVENILIPIIVNTKMATAPKMDKAQWAKVIEAVRRKTGLNQSQFAQRLGTTQSNVSKWENGVYEPSPDIYLQLAGMADVSDADFLYLRAKLHPDQIERLKAPAEAPTPRPQPVIEVLATRGATAGSLLKKMPDVVAVPLLADAAAAGSPRMIEEAKLEDTLLLPRKWCPHPDSMVCIRVKGNSMSPILEEDYVVAIDTSVNTNAELYNRMVAARDPEGGVTIKWLRKLKNGKEALVAQHTSQDYDPVIISDERGWKLIGPVTWWVGYPPPPKKGRRR